MHNDSSWSKQYINLPLLYAFCAEQLPSAATQKAGPWRKKIGRFKYGGYIICTMEPKCEIRCQHCKRWFPSGIQFGSAKAFFTSTLVGNRQQCPYCGNWTDCNKENMRFQERGPDGRVIYVEGKDVF